MRAFVTKLVYLLMALGLFLVVPQVNESQNGETGNSFKDASSSPVQQNVQNKTKVVFVGDVLSPEAIPLIISERTVQIIFALDIFSQTFLSSIQSQAPPFSFS